MQLSLQNFSTLVQNMAAAVQSAASQTMNLAAGSVTRAILEANASVALWMQWLALQVLQSTRASTSVGSDLDSWMADFGMTRLPATASSGLVTFSRYTPTQSALIPVGTLIRTLDGTQTFIVVADSTNAGWSAPQNGFLVPAAVASWTVPAMAQVAGTAGNVQAGAITQLAGAVPGIDAVINNAPFTGGLDAESDQALRSRFQTFLASRARATPVAVQAAIASVQQGLTATLQEGVDPAGQAAPGQFLITLDDGSGVPPANLLAAVQAAVDSVRPVGTTFAVQPPIVLPAAIALTLTIAPSAFRPSVEAAVSSAISSFVNSLGVGATLPITKLAQLAYAADPSVLNVTGLTVNGQTSDLVPALNGVVKTASLSVN